MALARGDLMPQFAVTTLDGRRFDYSQIWQRRNLLLMVIPPQAATEDVERYVAEIAGRTDELEDYDATCVATTDTVAGVVPPAVVIADRWGEIYFIATGRQLSELPGQPVVFETLRSIAHECPECQGEAR
jgi:hypothetical protein